MSLLHRLQYTEAPGWTILVRLLVGLVVFFPEGLQKLMFADILGAGRFARIGIPFPEIMGPFVGVVETVCGVLIILGLCTRLAAIPLIVIMIVAITSTKIPILLGHDFWIFHLPADIKRVGFWAAQHEARADFTMLLVATGTLELAPDHIISTTLYNGQFPGSLIRFKEGQRAVVDIYNDTDVPELVHWHGQMIPSDVDGSAEEGSPFVPAHGMCRISFVPRPAGFRFYHTHVVAGADLNRGTYTGQAGPVYIEPRNEPGAYDQEIFLVMKEFEPSFSRGGDMAMDMLAPGVPIKALKEMGTKADEEAKGTPKGYEVGYELFSINGKMLGAGEPIRVKPGERVLLHVLNASATEIRSVALPGHVFRVVALDGNPVPTPIDVPALWLGTAERVSAVVEMNHPGVFVLGDLSDDDRGHGMGIVVEYAGHTGKPKWAKPKPFRWDYTRFGKADAGALPAPDQTIEMLIVKHNAAANGFNLWTLNGEAFSMETMKPLYKIEEGRRYRLKFRNASDDIHPLHLHRHSFELVNVGGKPTAGVIKDVVMLGGFQESAFDFVADNLGRTLFHCHQQLHMDFGFMALFDYA